MPGDPQLTWNLIADVQHLFDFPFMVNAMRAGTIVAITAAIVGWFMVLRRQAFTGHTLAVVGFPGAAAAVLIGASPTSGYFMFAIAAAAVLIIASHVNAAYPATESAVTGTLQAFALASGYLFVSLSHQNVSGAQALLFGSFLGITDDQVVALLVGALVTLLILGVMARPLFFASLDPVVAAARGVPVRLLSAIFLLLLGVAAAEASQVTGSLLVFALLVLPAATAERLAVRPAVSLGLAIAIAVLVTWASMAASYYNDYPIGFYVTTLSFGAYVLAWGWFGIVSKMRELRVS